MYIIIDFVNCTYILVFMCTFRKMKFLIIIIIIINI